MNMQKAVFVFCTFCGLLMATHVWGDEPSDGVVRHASEATVYEPVADTDFRGELTLGFPSLRTLGSRIDDARLEYDPVALGNLSRELKIAETVSGKKAKITSGQLMKEAVEMAKYMNGLPELQALSAMVEDTSTRQDLEKDILIAQKRVAEQERAFKAGERPKAISGTLTIYNYAPEDVAVYYNGYRLGTVSGNWWQNFYVGDYSGYPYHRLEARGEFGNYWTWTWRENWVNGWWRLDPKPITLID